METYLHQKYKNFHYLIALILLFALFFAGCRTSPDFEDDVSQVVVTEVYVVTGEEVVITRIIEQTPTPTPVPTPVEEENPPPVVLDLMFLQSEPPGIDPQQSVNKNGVDLIENLFVGLTTFNQVQNRVDPYLATEWEVSGNGRIWTFYLRDDVFWVKPVVGSNNELLDVEAIRPVTANDFVFAVQRACSREPNAPDAFTLFIIEACEAVNTTTNPTTADIERIGVKALNDTTLQFTLTKPAVHFLTLTSLWFMRPLPPELIEEAGDEWQSDEDAEWWTSGPYFAHDLSLQTLQINPLWPLDRPEGANVDIVHINYSQQDGEIDPLALWEDKQLDVLDASNLDTTTLSERTASHLQFVPDQTLHYLGFNFDSGVFREPEVRRAFSAAIDRERLIEEIFGSQALGMRHLIPPGVVSAAPIDEAGVGYSPDYARQQMAESGFRNCRLMPEITLLVSSADLSLQQAELIRRMWIEELECSEDQINIEQTQFGTLLANTRANAGSARPDAWELAWASYYPDAHNWTGDLLHCEDSENRRNRPCSDVDELIRQANNVVNSADRRGLYREIENLFFGENGLVPIVPLYVRGNPILVQSWLEFTPAIFGGDQFATFVIDVERKELERSR